MKNPILKIHFVPIIFVSILLFFGCAQKSELELARQNAARSKLHYQHAVELYKRAIVSAKDKDQAIFELGRLYYEHGDYKQARLELEKTVSPGAAKFLALTEYRLANFSSAYDIFRKNKFSDGESLYYYGLAAEKLNLFDEAVKIYKSISGSRSKEALARIEAIRMDGPRHIKDLGAPLDSLLANAPGAKEYPLAGALILSCDESVEVRSDGTQVTNVYYLVKILNERGKEDFAEAKIDYDSTFEKVELEYARTIKPDGQVAEVGSANIRDVSKYMNFPLYSNARLYIISFPEVSQGAALEYKLKISRSSLINKKDFIMAYPVQAQEPVLSANFSLILPKNLQLHYKIINEEYNTYAAELAPSRQELEGGSLLYKWSFVNIPQLLPESNMPPDSQLNPTVLLSTFGDWREVYDWWQELSKPSLKVSRPIKDKVAELIKGKPTQEAKLSAIYDFCATNIRYVAVEYGQAGYQPHQAEDIYRNKYGDCKDQAVLLVTMLKEAGITAHLVLISTYDYYDLLPQLPSALFNHAIAAAKIGEKYIFLDPTASTCSSADLPPSDQGRKVLIFMDEGYRIEETPLFEAKHNTVTQRTDIVIDARGAITARRIVTPSGFYNQAQRYWLLYTQPESVRETLKERIQSISIGSVLNDYTITGLDDLDDPVVLNYDFYGPEYFIAAGPMRIMPALASLDTSLTAKENRNFPVDIFAPDRKETIFEITIPDNYDIKYMPANVSQNSKWFAFEAQYRQLNNKIVFRQVGTFKQRQIPREDYADFKKFYDAAAQSVKQNIILEEKK